MGTAAKPAPISENLRAALKKVIIDRYDYNPRIGLKAAMNIKVPDADDLAENIDLIGPFKVANTDNFTGITITKAGDTFKVTAIKEGSTEPQEICIITKAELNASKEAKIFGSIKDDSFPRTQVIAPALGIEEAAKEYAFLIKEARSKRKECQPNLIIDIGHLGNKNDLGANGNKLNEPTINMPVAVALMRQCHKAGINVWFTAEDLTEQEIFCPEFKDAILTPKTRRVIIDEFAAQHNDAPVVAVSLHSNSADTNTLKGIEIIPANEASSGIAKDIAGGYEQSGFKLHIHKQNGGVFPLSTRPRAGNILGGTAECPRILVESFYISNSADAAKAKEQDAAAKCGASIFDAVSKHFDTQTATKDKKPADKKSASVTEKNLDNLLADLNLGDVKIADVKSYKPQILAKQSNLQIG
mgnify:CR=1 FL=1